MKETLKIVTVTAIGIFAGYLLIEGSKKVATMWRLHQAKARDAANTATIPDGQ